jgi:hypothetical protein
MRPAIRKAWLLMFRLLGARSFTVRPHNAPEYDVRLEDVK